MTQEETGSWVPTVVVVLIFLLKWLLTSQNNTAVGIRRFVQMKVCLECASIDDERGNARRDDYVNPLEIHYV